MQSGRQTSSPWLPCLYAVSLFVVNFAIVRRLFSTEFTQYTGSNEGAFMAISRFLLDHAGLVHDLQELLGMKVHVGTEKSLHWYVRDRILHEAKPL